FEELEHGFAQSDSSRVARGVGYLGSVGVASGDNRGRALGRCGAASFDGQEFDSQEIDDRSLDQSSSRDNSSSRGQAKESSAQEARHVRSGRRYGEFLRGNESRTDRSQADSERLDARPSVHPEQNQETAERQIARGLRRHSGA